METACLRFSCCLHSSLCHAASNKCTAISAHAQYGTHCTMVSIRSRSGELGGHARAGAGGYSVLLKESERERTALGRLAG